MTKARDIISMGIFAHVDSGKTTLSEEILFLCGAIRKRGRVDHGDTFLDTDAMEKARGITVFPKEARFLIGEKEIVLIDTPGHGDFGPKMERIMQVLDYAVLVISGPDGVQSHTATLWTLLERYEIPTFIFVNKMDQQGTDPDEIMEGLRRDLNCSCLANMSQWGPEGTEAIALASDVLTEEFLETGEISMETLGREIGSRKVFPVYFGSALKSQGVKEFVESFGSLAVTGCETSSEEGKNESESNGTERQRPERDKFGARVYRITRDKQGNRLTHLRVTGGLLTAKMVIEGSGKAEQIRLYSGDNFEMVQGAGPGQICAVTGLTGSYAGQGLGMEEDSHLAPLLEPTLTFKVNVPEGIDPDVAMKKLKVIEDEEPTLSLSWKEATKEIHVNVMGELGLDVLKQTAKDRFDMDLSFGQGTIIYKETIAEPVLGIGHYEPLRHYSEVELLMEPLPAGSGLEFDVDCPAELLAVNWQRLVLTHLREKKHMGVLTGAEITDMRITLVGGKAHLKHTEGGDFRQATYRAVRQGLRKAESVLLEPFCNFRLEVPAENVGRALADLQKLGATTGQGDSYDVIEGRGPISTMGNYARDVLAYTSGKGRFFTSPGGYFPCGDQEKIVQETAYDPEGDLENSTGSIFCSGGAAVYVPWDMVDDVAHVDVKNLPALKSMWSQREKDGDTLQDVWDDMQAGGTTGRPAQGSTETRYREGRLTKAEEEELDKIFKMTYGSSKRDETIRRARISKASRSGTQKHLGGKPPADENYPKLNWSSRDGSGEAKNSKNNKKLILIDGYNLLFAWDDLKALSEVSMDGAREALIEILANYQGYSGYEIHVVFDGYRASGSQGSTQDYGNVKLSFTREGLTADGFIQEEVYRRGKKQEITVVTSDKAVQMAALGDGAVRMSSREFIAELLGTSEMIREKIRKLRPKGNRPFEGKL